MAINADVVTAPEYPTGRLRTGYRADEAAMPAWCVAPRTGGAGARGQIVEAVS